MNTFKEKLITLLLTVTMIIGGLPFGVFAEGIEDNDNNQVPVEDKEEREDLHPEDKEKDGSEDIENQENQEPQEEQKEPKDDIMPEEDKDYDEQTDAEDWQIYYIDKASGEDILSPKYVSEIKEEDLDNMIKSNIEHIDGYEYDFYQIVTSESETNTLFLIYNKAVEDEFYHVTFNYIDVDTKETIAKPLTSDDLVNGQKYDLTKFAERTLGGYQYVKTEGKVSGIIEKNEQVNVYYRKYKVENFKVTIQYLDQDTNKEIAKSFVLEPGENDYDVSKQAQKKIDGYKYIKTVGIVKGNLYKQNGNEVIKVYYEKTKAPSDVKTGDYNNIIMWIAIALVAIILFLLVIRKNRKY